MLTMIFGPCKCATILDSRGIKVIDSQNLPLSSVTIISLIVDGRVISIFTTFPAINDFIDRLNSDKVDFKGSFLLFDDGIFYTNPEGYENVEVVAIIREQITVVKVGEPNYTIGLPFIERDNGSVFSFLPSTPLGGLRMADIHSVRIGGENVEPSASKGYIFSGNQGNSLFDFSGVGGVQNEYIYFNHSQSLSHVGVPTTPDNGIVIETYTAYLNGESSLALPSRFADGDVILVTSNGVVIYHTQIDARLTLTYSVNDDGTLISFSESVFGIVSITGIIQTTSQPLDNHLTTNAGDLLVTNTGDLIFY